MSEFSSSRIKESSLSSSSKVSSSSVSSSSTKVASSSLSSSSVSGRERVSASSEVDDLLAASAAARETARGIASNLSSGGRSTRSTDLVDIDDLLAGVSISGGALSSSSSVSSSSKKQISSISQSSMEMVEGTDVGSKASVKSTSSSVSSSSLLAKKQSSVDGELVSSETIAEKASRKAESQKEKLIEDGQVVAQSGFSTEQTSAAKLRATKEMSQQELDAFFKQQSITGKPVEALNFDKDNNSFEMKLNDLPEFSPQELTVKIVDDVITIYGTHTEKTDEGNYKTHQYVRRYTVPKGLKADNVDWKLELDGVLAIKAGDSVKAESSVCHLDCTIFKPRSFFKK